MINRILLATTLAVSSTTHAACLTANEVPIDSSAALSVKLATMEVVQDEGHRNIASLGTIENTSEGCFEEVVVEVRYFDAAHRVIDTVVEPMYGVVVPPHSEVAIRVLNAAAKPKEAYATQEARVLSAEPRISHQKPKSTLWATFGDFLVSWGPMLLLIGVWVYFMQRMRRKDSPQERSIALLQQQVEISTQQAQALKQIAAALEGLAASRRDS